MIDIKCIVPEVAQENVGVTILVIVPNHNSHSVTCVAESALFGDVHETPITKVAIESIGRNIVKI